MRNRFPYSFEFEKYALKILIYLFFYNGFLSIFFTVRAFYFVVSFLDNTEKNVIAAFTKEFSFFVFCFEIFRYKIFKFADLFSREFLIFIKKKSVKYVCGFITS